MKKFIILAVVIIILISLGYFRQPGPKLITIALIAQNQSSEHGQAVLTEVDGQIKVELKMVNATSEPEPVSINRGRCVARGEAVYSLNPMTSGSSVTTITASFVALEANLPLAISVHNSCGDLVLE